MPHNKNNIAINTSMFSGGWFTMICPIPPCGIYQKEYHPHVKIDTYSETNSKKYSPAGHQGCNNRKLDEFVKE